MLVQNESVSNINIWETGSQKSKGFGIWVHKSFKWQDTLVGWFLKWYVCNKPCDLTPDLEKLVSVSVAHGCSTVL